jgi:hypothetical protein
MTTAEREVLIGADPETSLAIGASVPDAHGCQQIPFRIVGGAIHASAGAVLVERPATDLSCYFDGLARDWRGWTGAKEWRDDEGHISMSAVHDGKGTVLLTVQIRNKADRSSGHWAATAVVPIEPGQLDRIASEVRSNA